MMFFFYERRPIWWTVQSFKSFLNVTIVKLQTENLPQITTQFNGEILKIYQKK